jgi:Na+-translocating ferredoxin:NAD+ oxidoreductase RnfG subunit
MSLLRILGASGAALATPLLVHATQYATLEEAARRTFPEATAWREQLVPATAQDGRSAPWRMLIALKDEEPLGVVVADAVIGKFELIDYAVGIGSDGKVRNVEVLAYRESHGYEIKLPAWRAQFAGKGVDAKLRIGEDIANISGATLSCTHVTDGVRRIVALVARLHAAGRL